MASTPSLPSNDNHNLRRAHGRFRPGTDAIVQSGNGKGREQNRPLPDTARSPARYDRTLALLSDSAPVSDRARVEHDRAVLEDTLAFYAAARSEVYSELEALNENTALANAQIDLDIAALRAERERIDGEMMGAINVARDRHHRSLEAEALARVRAGEDRKAVEEEISRLAVGTQRLERSEGDTEKPLADTEASAPMAASTRRFPKLALPKLAFGRRTRQNGPVQPTPSVPEAAQPVGLLGPLGTNRGTTRFVPGDLEAQVQVRVRPIDAIAVEHGLPARWFSATPPDPTGRLKRFGPLFQDQLPTVVGGGLFGLSLGQVLGVVDARQMVTAPDLEMIPGFFSAFVGMVVFGAIGKGVYRHAVFSGELSASATISAQGAPCPRIPHRLRWHAYFANGACLVNALLLAFIEATVERQGLVRAFLDRDVNRMLAGGGVSLAPQSPTGLESWALVLCVILPYLYGRLVSGWIHGWTGSARGWLESLHVTEVAAIRRAEYEKEEVRLAEFNELEREEWRRAYSSRRDAVSGPAQAVSGAPSVAESWQPTEEGDPEAVIGLQLPDAESDPATEGAERWGSIPTEARWAPGAVSAGLVYPTVPSTPAEAAALAVAETRSALSDLKHHWARRRDAIAHVDPAIQRLEAQRTEERREPSSEDMARVDRAYGAVVEAATRYDASVNRLIRRADRLGRRDLLARVHRAVVDNPSPHNDN
jgi:hypothetical protein